MVQKQQHPSVLLQSGDITDFQHAMDITLEQHQFELRDAQRNTRTLLSEEGHSEALKEMWRRDLREQTAFVETYIALVEKALVIYDDIMAPAKAQVVAALRAEHNAYLNDIADALEHNDYTGLAI